MTVLPITMIGDPVLPRPATPLSPAELADPGTQRFIDDLIETKRAARGAGQMFDRHERRAFEEHARAVVERWGS